jgi:Transposase DNA-binding/Transposase DDE domain
VTQHPFDIAALASEVAGSSFSDKRLNARLKLLVEQLAKDPSLSLPQSFDSAGLEAAYRFFSNPRVTPEDILAPHIHATRSRCEAQGDYLIVHDTTTFSYRFDGERKGLGRSQPSNANSSQVLFAHVSLALAADGTRRPLGVAALKTWTRGLEPTGVERKRWEEQFRVASDQLNRGKNAIHLADREADNYEMFTDLLEDGLRFVVRCQFNRYLEASLGITKLRDRLASLSSTVDRDVPLNRRKPRRTKAHQKIYPAREMRIATLSVAAASVELLKPKGSSAQAKTQAINVLRVWEANPPAHVVPIEWLLYTSEPIETPEQQLKVVDYYRARWTIEEYFKAIKTGCGFEKKQLQDFEALTNLLATFAPIAYRMLLLRSEVVRAPQEPAATVLSTDELDVLRARGRLVLPAEPTLSDAYLAIAALGGHIKYSGNPGWLTLARGYRKLDLLVEGWVEGRAEGWAQGWAAAKLQLSSDQG